MGFTWLVDDLCAFVQADSAFKVIGDGLHGLSQPPHVRDNIARRYVVIKLVVDESLDGVHGDIEAFGHRDEGAPQVMGGKGGLRGFHHLFHLTLGFHQIALAVSAREHIGVHGSHLGGCQ